MAARPRMVGTSQMAPGCAVSDLCTRSHTCDASLENPTLFTSSWSNSGKRPLVRLRNWPVPTWLTQASIDPLRSARKTTNLPSPEIEASSSAPSKSVNRVI